MKYILYLILLSESLFFFLANDKAGVKIAAKQNVILDFQKKYLPMLLSKIGQINVPDQSLDIDAKIGTLHIYLTQINFQITNLLSDNIFVEFNQPSNIIISAKEISGNGQLYIKYKLGFISETDKIVVNIKRVDCQVAFKLGTTNSHLVPGKLIPTASIEYININLDFDFDIHGSIIASIVDLVKGKIKSIINDQIQNNLKIQIIQKVNELITDSVNQLPVYVPLGQFDLAVDYSLISAPKVLDNYIIINSNGAIVNPNNPDTLVNPYIIPDNLPDYDQSGKLAQVFASDYSINTAFRTLHLTKLLKIKISSSDIPSDSPVQLNTTSLDLILNGLTEVYGKEKLVDIECETKGDPPKVDLFEGEAIGAVIGECSIFVQIDNSTSYEKALAFNTTITANANALMTEGGNITANIKKIHLDKSQMTYSKVPKADIRNLENLFNFSSNLIVPFINNKYLSYLTISLPSVDGIYFNDSKIQIQNNYFEINLTPKVTLSEKEKLKKEKNKKNLAMHFIYLGY